MDTGGIGSLGEAASFIKPKLPSQFYALTNYEDNNMDASSFLTPRLPAQFSGLTNSASTDIFANVSNSGNAQNNGLLGNGIINPRLPPEYLSMIGSGGGSIGDIGSGDSSVINTFSMIMEAVKKKKAGIKTTQTQKNNNSGIQAARPPENNSTGSGNTINFRI